MTRSLRSHTLFLFALALVLLILPGTVDAQDVPRILSYQGQLLDDGQPVEGSVDVTFRLHTDPDGSATLDGWEEVRTVTPSNGVFSVLLGDTSDGGSALPESIVDESELYLGVSVNGDEIDRMRLTSTAFALGAHRAAEAALAERAEVADRADIADVAESVEDDAAVTRLNTLRGDLRLRAEGGAEIEEDEEDGTITIRAGSGGGTAGVTSIDARGGLEADPETGDVQIRIADEGVTSSKIADGAVSNAKLADEAILERTLQDGAVTGAKIASETITGSNLEDEAIRTSKIEDGAVTGVKIDEETIESSNIASDAITTRTIADGAVIAGVSG